MNQPRGTGRPLPPGMLKYVARDAIKAPPIPASGPVAPISALDATAKAESKANLKADILIAKADEEQERAQDAVDPPIKVKPEVVFKPEKLKQESIRDRTMSKAARKQAIHSARHQLALLGIELMEVYTNLGCPDGLHGLVMLCDMAECTSKAIAACFSDIKADMRCDGLAIDETKTIADPIEQAPLPKWAKDPNEKKRRWATFGANVLQRIRLQMLALEAAGK